MNNLKKIGLTALAGSLVAVSANAGTMTVSGSLGATYSSQDGNTGTVATDSGQGFGSDKDFQVSGSGELDNGWSFSGYTLTKDDLTVSSSALTLTMGSLGSVSVGHGFGGASTKYDVQTPTAYEEVDDSGATSLSANFVGSWADNNSLVYASPSYDVAGLGTVSFDAEYTPEASGTSPADGGTVSSSLYGTGYSLGLTVESNGVKAGIYGSERTNTQAKVDEAQDSFQGVYYVNYSYGPVSVGVSQSYYDSGLRVASELATATKEVGVAGGIFESTTMSIAYNINDNLSISYAKATDEYDSQQDNTTAAAATIEDTDMDFKTVTAAYSMGSMSIKALHTSIDNVGYDTNGGSLDTLEIALGLAF
jgi:outer membrane protein OmpU